jgi:hypothetical protein
MKTAGDGLGGTDRHRPSPLSPRRRPEIAPPAILADADRRVKGIVKVDFDHMYLIII